MALGRFFKIVFPKSKRRINFHIVEFFVFWKNNIHKLWLLGFVQFIWNFSFSYCDQISPSFEHLKVTSRCKIHVIQELVLIWRKQVTNHTIKFHDHKSKRHLNKFIHEAVSMSRFFRRNSLGGCDNHDARTPHVRISENDDDRKPSRPKLQRRGTGFLHTMFRRSSSNLSVDSMGTNVSMDADNGSEVLGDFEEYETCLAPQQPPTYDPHKADENLLTCAHFLQNRPIALHHILLPDEEAHFRQYIISTRDCFNNYIKFQRFFLVFSCQSTTFIIDS